jgi:hypothetical protein
MRRFGYTKHDWEVRIMKATQSGPESPLFLNPIAKRTYDVSRHRRLSGFVRIAVVAIIAFGTMGILKADSTVTWTLNSVVFASGQTASGSFTLQNGTLTDWDVQLTGGTNPVLTNITFRPGGSCVSFCGELYDTTTPYPTQSGFDVRTALAPDNTFFELNLYFNNATVSGLASPNTSTIGVNPFSAISDDLLLSGITVTDLSNDALNKSATSASIILTPEPATPALFSIAFAILFVFTNARRFWRGRAARVGSHAGACTP